MTFFRFLWTSWNFFVFSLPFFYIRSSPLFSACFFYFFFPFFSLFLILFCPFFLPFFVLLSSSSLLFSAFFCNIERIGSMSCLRFCGLFVFFLIKKILAFLFVFNRPLTFSGGLFFQLLLKVVCPQLIRLCSWDCRDQRKAGHLWLSSCYWLALEKKMPNSIRQYSRSTVGDFCECCCDAFLEWDFYSF